MDNYIGEIRIFPYDRIPKGWMACEGQVMQVRQNQPLFALLGTMYGGDGVTTFNLPDLRGRAVMAAGRSPYSGNIYNVGKAGGVESETLSLAEIPQHNHFLTAMNSTATALMNATPPAETLAQPIVNLSSTSKINVNAYAPTGTNVMLPATSVQPTGGNIAHENRIPLIAFRVCIATTGLWPTRS